MMSLLPTNPSSPVAAAGGTLDGDINDPGKMFVGGLSWTTTEDRMKEYFSKFGEVLECCIMQDPITKRSRGFGFVKFDHPDSVDRVVDNPHIHVIDGKKVDPKKAVPKNQSKVVSKTKKVFLGGLPPETSEDDIRAYFGQYGEIEEVMLMYDKNTQRLRGFGFVKFTKEESADDACREHYHEIRGKMCEAKKAQPKEVMNQVAAAQKSSTQLGLMDSLPLLYRTQSLIAYNPAAAYSAALAQSIGSFGAAAQPNPAFYPMLMQQNSMQAQICQPKKPTSPISMGSNGIFDTGRALTPGSLGKLDAGLGLLGSQPTGQQKGVAGTPPAMGAGGMFDLYAANGFGAGVPGNDAISILNAALLGQQAQAGPAGASLFTDTQALLAASAFAGYQ